jgi:hypothetical protein
MTGDLSGKDLQSAKSTTKNKKWGLLTWLVGIITLFTLIWLNFPFMDQLARGPYTPTVPSPSITSTPKPTLTPTVTSTSTVPPTITPTPYPPSAFVVQDISGVVPELKGVQGSAIVLNDDKNVEVQPPFDDPQWIPSDTIAKQLGKEIPEPYYSTFGAGSAAWKMDVPLAPGLYEIFVLDTLYSSGGTLDFHIYLGSQEIGPTLGSSRVEYQSSRAESPQNSDEWRSIGIYNFDRPDVLSVSTNWGKRDEKSIVAIDRVLIVPMPSANMQMLASLPKSPTTVIVDDLAADIQSPPILFPDKSVTAWNGQFQYVVNPDQEVKAKWTVSDSVPPGVYEIFIWIPEIHATGSATYTLMVNGKDLNPDNSQEPVTIIQSEHSGGQWVSLGTYTTPPIYEKPVDLSVQMDIKPGTTGDLALDAVAFVKK